MKNNSFEYRNISDFIVRVLAVGIFAVENHTHLLHFSHEVDTFVTPAISPLPHASIVHAITIFLGQTGSLLFIASGFRRMHSKARISLSMLITFMVIITWNWWFRRFGKFIWEIEDPAERRNRTIHCLKNLSIFGLLLVVRKAHAAQITDFKKIV
jgi:uncharacterized membrane protein YphA (DoxX/SURF4 family)